jgi:hypothetical protein
MNPRASPTIGEALRLIGAAGSRFSDLHHRSPRCRVFACVIDIFGALLARAQTNCPANRRGGK